MISHQPDFHCSAVAEFYLFATDDLQDDPAKCTAGPALSLSRAYEKRHASFAIEEEIRRT